MNNDFSELIKYLDEKFNDIDEKFDNVKNNINILQASVEGYAKNNFF